MTIGCSRERVPRAVKLLGGTITPQDVARATADAIERDRDRVIMPRKAEIFVS